MQYIEINYQLIRNVDLETKKSSLFQIKFNGGLTVKLFNSEKVKKKKKKR